MIAPVGSEVVLMAGVTGQAGTLIKRQPIEWTLSQDSVGQIVDFSDRDRCWSSSEKLSADFVKTRTSTRGVVVTRGTPSVTDDVVQQAGQTWVSLTSASEGTSYVTVVAPEGSSWPERRKTATVYWVDAQWVFPAPQTVRAGQPHALRTSVTRTATGAPVSNWIVRYEFAGGVPATLGPTGATAIEVRTDENGVATAMLQPTTGDPGTTQVRILVIRPASTTGNAPKTQIGEGFTTVGWSAPGLSLRATGPPTADVEAALVYRLEVSNPGDVVTTGVVVRDFIPPGLKFMNSSPPAQMFGDRAEWQLGDLAPKDTRVIEINCRADAGGNVRYRFEATSSSNLRTEAYVDTQIARPSLTLDVTGPNQATVGEQVQFRVQVSNLGDRPLERVTITDLFDAGLEQTEGQASPVQQVMGTLQPGETKVIGLSFIVRRAGDLCHTVEVTAAGGQFANAQACLTADAPRVEPRPQLQVAVTGPEEGSVGGEVTFSTTVSNTGNTPVAGIQLVNVMDASLEPTKTSPGLDRTALATGQLMWVIPQLSPGESVRRDVQCVCRQPAVGAVVQALATASPDISESAETRLTIINQPSNAPMDNEPALGPTVMPPGPVTNGMLDLTISDSNDPVSLGEQTTYVITIKNLQSVPDQRVALTIQLPVGLEFRRLNGPVGVQNISEDRQTVQATPVAELRAGEALPAFSLEAIATAAGNHKLTVRVTSRQMPQGVADEETTTVLD